LQQRLDALVRKLTVGAGVIVGVVFALGLARGVALRLGEHGQDPRTVHLPQTRGGKPARRAQDGRQAWHRLNPAAALLAFAARHRPRMGSEAPRRRKPAVKVWNHEKS